MQLSIRLGDASDLAWAQATVTEHHYLHRPVDPRARPMVYVVEHNWATVEWGEFAEKPVPKSWWLPPGYPSTYKVARPKTIQHCRSVGLVMLGIPHATRCGGWWGYEGLPTQWQVVDLCRIWLDPAVQFGGQLCQPGQVPGYTDRRGQWRPTVATWAIRETLSRVQADRVRLWPPVYPEQPYHILLAISYHDPQFHRGTIYRESHAEPMYFDHRTGQPKPGPSGKYGWCWRLPSPAWAWHDLTAIRSRTMRLF